METKKDEQTTQDLDVIMKEGLQQFEITTEDNAAAPDNDKGASPDVNEEKKAAAAEAAAAAAKTAKRFKGHDEAEQGYKDLQAKETRTAMENAELKKQLAAQEAADKQKKDAETVASATTNAAAKFEVFATERRTKLLDEIDALDPDAKDYRSKVAAAQARADRDILTAGQKVAAAAHISVEAPPVKKDPPATETKPTYTADQVTDYTRKVISDTKIGLEPDDVLFWNYAGKAPAKDEQGNALTLDQQIDWAVAQTKQYHSKINPQDPKQEIADAAKTAAANQRNEMPLGRASSGAPAKTDPDNDKPFSLGDAVEAANDQRRL